jgi:hypothetical protein
MRSHRGRVLGLAVLVALAGCAPTPKGTDTPSVAQASPSERREAFPTAAFADISEDPVSEEAAAQFQAILDDMAGGGGMAATVMTADGTWSGATGKADGVRDVGSTISSPSRASQSR